MTKPSADVHNEVPQHITKYNDMLQNSNKIEELLGKLEKHKKELKLQRKKLKNKFKTTRAGIEETKTLIQETEKQLIEESAKLEEINALAIIDGYQNEINRNNIYREKVHEIINVFDKEQQRKIEDISTDILSMKVKERVDFLYKYKLMLLKLYIGHTNTTVRHDLVKARVDLIKTRAEPRIKRKVLNETEN